MIASKGQQVAFMAIHDETYPLRLFEKVALFPVEAKSWEFVQNHFIRRLDYALKGERSIHIQLTI